MPASKRGSSTARPTTSATTSPRSPSTHDLNATVLHLLGINHEKLTYSTRGRDFRLTDIHGNNQGYSGVGRFRLWLRD
ncbi:MAG: DUF1501 domain-containing protein [Planctomycetales bacterium]